MDIKDELGKKIKTFRLQKNLTREAFCEDELELTVRQLSRIESGQSLPTLPKLTYISQVLAVPIHHLIDEKHMELPSRYVELKHNIYKVPTYNEPKLLKKREQYFDEIYEELPEEEQLAVDVLQALLDVHVSEDVNFGQGIIDEYFFQIKNKTKYTINDLLIIDLYFACIFVEGFDDKLFNEIVHKVIEQVDFLVGSDLFYIQKVLFVSTGIMVINNRYRDLWQIIEVLKIIMQKSQDFSQKPILAMLEGKYYLFEKIISV